MNEDDFSAWPLMLAFGVIMVMVILNCGCVMIWAPEARRFSAYSHDQQAISMPIRQEIQPQASVVREMTGISAASKNTVSIRPSK